MRGPDCPYGVLITRSISPARICSTTMFAGPRPRSACATTSTSIPLRRNISAVPSVATTVNPRSASRFTGNTIDRLSALATETNTVPEVGSEPYDAVCDFANAGPKAASMPITSPVDRISGPSSESTPLPSGRRNRWNGITASLTATGAPGGQRPAVAGGRQQALGAQLGDGRAGHDPGRGLGQRHRGRLGRERHGPGRPRVGLQHVQRLVLERVLHVEQSAHPDRPARSPRCAPGPCRCRCGPA